MNLHTIKVVHPTTGNKIYEVMADTPEEALAAFKRLAKEERKPYLVHCDDKENEEIHCANEVIYLVPWTFMSDEYLSGQSNYGEKK
jgi:hypothetical protein